MMKVSLRDAAKVAAEREYFTDSCFDDHEDEDGVVEVDNSDDIVVSSSEYGAYVQAWMWVDHLDAEPFYREQAND
jgi:hypothetical protein